MWVTSRLLCGGSSGLTGVTHFQSYKSALNLVYYILPYHPIIASNSMVKEKTATETRVAG